MSWAWLLWSSIHVADATVCPAGPDPTVTVLVPSGADPVSATSSLAIGWSDEPPDRVVLVDAGGEDVLVVREDRPRDHVTWLHPVSPLAPESTYELLFALKGAPDAMVPVSVVSGVDDDGPAVPTVVVDFDHDELPPTHLTLRLSGTTSGAVYVSEFGPYPFFVSGWSLPVGGTPEGGAEITARVDGCGRGASWMLSSPYPDQVRIRVFDAHGREAGVTEPKLYEPRQSEVPGGGTRCSQLGTSANPAMLLTVLFALGPRFRRRFHSS